MSNSAAPRTVAHQAPLSSMISQSLLKFMSIESVILSKHPILCHPLLLPLVFRSIKVFSSELALCIWWPKYWCFSFSISPCNEYPGLISFRSPCCPRDSQESFPAPQFQSISSSAHNLLYGPVLTFLQDYWKKLSFDYLDL